MASFQTIQNLVLVTRQFEVALPVLIRLVGTDLEFLTLDPENPSDPSDNDNWQVLDRVTEEDMDDTTEVVKALGGDPAIVLANFPNCDSY